MKVAILHANRGKVLENDVNEFIQNKHVIDIKYQSVVHHTNGYDVINDRCMIMYEEGESDD